MQHDTLKAEKYAFQLKGKKKVILSIRVLDY